MEDDCTKAGSKYIPVNALLRETSMICALLCSKAITGKYIDGRGEIVI
jgi:hypothetical protein